MVLTLRSMSCWIEPQLCAGGSLLDLIKRKTPVTEERVAVMFRGIIKSVLHCHQARYIFRYFHSCA